MSPPDSLKHASLEKPDALPQHDGVFHKQHDPNWSGDDVDFSGVNEKDVLRKMDIRLIPVLAVLYLLSFLDRGNIGNAKIQGLTADLHLSGDEYNMCLTGNAPSVINRIMLIFFI